MIKKEECIDGEPIERVIYIKKKVSYSHKNEEYKSLVVSQSLKCSRKSIK